MHAMLGGRRPHTQLLTVPVPNCATQPEAHIVWQLQHVGFLLPAAAPHHHPLAEWRGQQVLRCPIAPPMVRTTNGQNQWPFLLVKRKFQAGEEALIGGLNYIVLRSLKA